MFDKFTYLWLAEMGCVEAVYTSYRHVLFHPETAVQLFQAICMLMEGLTRITAHIKVLFNAYKSGEHFGTNSYKSKAKNNLCDVRQSEAEGSIPYLLQ